MVGATRDGGFEQPIMIGSTAMDIHATLSSKEYEESHEVLLLEETPFCYLRQLLGTELPVLPCFQQQH